MKLVTYLGETYVLSTVFSFNLFLKKIKKCIGDREIKNIIDLNSLIDKTIIAVPNIKQVIKSCKFPYYIFVGPVNHD